jgi:hypothetical protein
MISESLFGFAVPEFSIPANFSRVEDTKFQVS